MFSKIIAVRVCAASRKKGIANSNGKKIASYETRTQRHGSTHDSEGAAARGRRKALWLRLGEGRFRCVTEAAHVPSARTQKIQCSGATRERMRWMLGILPAQQDGRSGATVSPPARVFIPFTISRPDKPSRCRGGLFVAAPTGCVPTRQARPCSSATAPGAS